MSGSSENRTERVLETTLFILLGCLVVTVAFTLVAFFFSLREKAHQPPGVSVGGVQYTCSPNPGGGWRCVAPAG